ncbi:hypothetical protein [Saccharopolyspora sp. NPDC002376]
MKPSPLVFFGLVFALGVPFWLLGESSDVRLPANLPLSALQVVVPGVAAALLICLSGGRVLEFLRGIFDASKIPRLWYLPALLLMPVITLISYVLMGQPLPQPPITLAWTPGTLARLPAFRSR